MHFRVFMNKYLWINDCPEFNSLHEVLKPVFVVENMLMT